jgi:hypothetical protein
MTKVGGEVLKVYDLLTHFSSQKCAKNAYTAICNLKKFPGEKPPDPRLEGRPRITRPGRGRLTQEGREGREGRVGSEGERRKGEGKLGGGGSLLHGLRGG